MASLRKCKCGCEMFEILVDKGESIHCAGCGAGLPTYFAKPGDFIICEQHSRWGKVEISAERVKNVVPAAQRIEQLGITQAELNSPPPQDTISYEYFFYHPNGEFFGSLDQGMGGSLGHPNEEVDFFIRQNEIDRLGNTDELVGGGFDQNTMSPNYIELEELIAACIVQHDPDFFYFDLIDRMFRNGIERASTPTHVLTVPTVRSPFRLTQRRDCQWMLSSEDIDMLRSLGVDFEGVTFYSPFNACEVINKWLPNLHVTE